MGRTGKEKKMQATKTREHRLQEEIKITTVTLQGKVQSFQHGTDGKVYLGGSTQYITPSQFEMALVKMRAAGATVEESTGYAF